MLSEMQGDLQWTCTTVEEVTTCVLNNFDYIFIFDMFILFFIILYGIVGLFIINSKKRRYD